MAKPVNPPAPPADSAPLTQRKVDRLIEIHHIIEAERAKSPHLLAFARKYLTDAKIADLVSGKRSRPEQQGFHNIVAELQATLALLPLESSVKVDKRQRP